MMNDYIINDYLPNPFCTDYQYSDIPLDLYTEDHMLKFAERIIMECERVINEQDKSVDLLKHFKIKRSSNNDS